MKTISCKDLGSTTCSFTATDETEDGVIKKMFDHADQHHKDLVEKDKEKMIQTMRAKLAQQK